MNYELFLYFNKKTSTAFFAVLEDKNTFLLLFYKNNNEKSNIVNLFVFIAVRFFYLTINLSVLLYI